MSLIKAQKARIKRLKMKQILLEIGIFIWMYAFIFCGVYMSLTNPKPASPVTYLIELVICYVLAALELEICIVADNLIVRYFKETKKAEEIELNELIARHIRLGGSYPDWDER